MEMEEIKDLPLGLRDILAYLIPGFAWLLVIMLAGGLPLTQVLSSISPGFLIAFSLIGAYAVGHAVSPLRVFTIGILSRLIGNPRTYLIDPAQRKPRLFRFLYHRPDFEAVFKSALIARLSACWGDHLIKGARYSVYELCARFVRQHSPLNALYVDRCISLRNMKASMVFPTVFLAVVLFVRLRATILGILCLLAAAFFLRSCASNMIEEAKVVYWTFYMLHHGASWLEERVGEVRRQTDAIT